MKVKINAGVDFETTTPGELRDELRAWQVELYRGVKFRHVLLQPTFGATWTYTPDTPGRDMPESGMQWKIKRVAMAGAGFVEGTDTFDYFVGDISPARVVGTGFTRQDTPDVVLPQGEGLAFSGVATGTGQLNISMFVVEAPYYLAGGVLL